MQRRSIPARLPPNSQPRAAAENSTRSGGQTGRQTAARPAIDPKWAWHYRILVGLRDRLLARQDEKLREATEPIEPHGMHEADSATDEFEHDLALTLLAADQSALTEITQAIQRIVDGTYGVCEATGVRLPKERLRAIPWCRYSREVEERLEKRGEVRFPRLPGVASIAGVEAGLLETSEAAEAAAEETAASRNKAEVEEGIAGEGRPGDGRKTSKVRQRQAPRSAAREPK